MKNQIIGELMDFEVGRLWEKMWGIQKWSKNKYKKQNKTNSNQMNQKIQIKNKLKKNGRGKQTEKYLTFL